MNNLYRGKDDSVEGCAPLRLCITVDNSRGKKRDQEVVEFCLRLTL
jgi:hypothetical protein